MRRRQGVGPAPFAADAQAAARERCGDKQVHYHPKWNRSGLKVRVHPDAGNDECRAERKDRKPVRRALSAPPVQCQQMKKKAVIDDEKRYAARKNNLTKLEIGVLVV